MRLPVDNGTLAVMVMEELQVRVSSGGRFTAYDVTRSLRRKQPGLNILHNPVRALVHQCMDQLVCLDEYQAVACNFGRATAVLYEPVRRGQRPGIRGVPLLPLN